MPFHHGKNPKPEYDLANPLDGDEERRRRLQELTQRYRASLPDTALPNRPMPKKRTGLVSAVAALVILVAGIVAALVILVPRLKDAPSSNQGQSLALSTAELTTTTVYPDLIPTSTTTESTIYTKTSSSTQLLTSTLVSTKTILETSSPVEDRTVTTDETTTSVQDSTTTETPSEPSETLPSTVMKTIVSTTTSLSTSQAIVATKAQVSIERITETVSGTVRTRLETRTRTMTEVSTTYIEGAGTEVELSTIVTTQTSTVDSPKSTTVSTESIPGPTIYSTVTGPS